MSKLQIYLVVSFSLFSSAIAKLYTTSDSFFDAYIAIFEKKGYFIILLNFLFAIGVITIMLIQHYFIGDFLETEYKQAMNDLFGFAFSLFINIYNMNMDFMTINFVILLLCRYLICLINVRVKSFSINYENSNAKSHRKMLLLQFLLFLYCFNHFVNSLKSFNESKINIILLNQYCLCCSFLFETIINQLIIINDDQNGNSITAYYGRQKVSFCGSIISLVISAFTGIIILRSHYHSKMILAILVLYDPINDTFKKITSYTKWRQFCSDLNRFLSSPTEEELQEHDICIICRMKMNKEYAKKLPCGHIFHLDCMIVWFGTRQVCPICGADIQDLLKQANIDSTDIHHHDHIHDHNHEADQNDDFNQDAFNDENQNQVFYADFDNIPINDVPKSKINNNHQEVVYSFSDFGDLDDEAFLENIQDNEESSNLMLDQIGQDQSDLNKANGVSKNLNNYDNADLAEELKQTRELLKEFEQRVRFLEGKLQKKDE